MPYVSEKLILKEKPLLDARIKRDGTIVNGGEEGYPCLAIRELTRDAVGAFGNSATALRRAFRLSNPNHAVKILECPILGAIPEHPYTAQDGYTYEKSLWDQWVHQCSVRPNGVVTSPTTREIIREEPIENKLFADIVKDLSKEAPEPLNIGLGGRTYGDIWADFIRRLEERVEDLQEHISIAGGFAGDAALQSAQSNPLAASSLATSAGTSTVALPQATLEHAVGSAEDTSSAGYEATSLSFS